MKSLLCLLSLIILCFQGQSQSIITGKVVNADNKEPIPYANIGIKNTEVGTISNEDGSFVIRIPTKYASKQLWFSSIGFTPQSINIASLAINTELLISLQEEIVKLDPINITAKPAKTIREKFGNGRSLFLSGQLNYDSASAGSAMALLIDKKGHNQLNYIHKASLYIARNLSPEFKVRLRFMEVDPQTNQPGKDLISTQFIKTSNIRRGWLEFDFKQVHEIKDSSFYLVFEWVLDNSDRRYIIQKYIDYMNEYPDRVSYDTVIIDNEKLSVPIIGTVVAGTVFGTTSSKNDLEQFTCYSRLNSFGAWQKATGILSAKVIMSNKPISVSMEIKKTPCQDGDTICKVNKWSERFKEHYNSQGLQLSIMKDDSLLFSKGYGYSDIELETAVTPQTQFRIASISKTMTATAIMQLAIKGKLNLDSSVYHYVPAFPKKRHSMTIRQLAGHLGGIRGYYGKDWSEIFIQEHYENASEALSIFKDDSLAVEPGKQFLYSSYGYILLGAAIENTSGKTYLNYMAQNIWSPLQMNATYGDVSDSIMEDKSKFYYLTGAEAKPYDLSYSYPTGGLISTTNDMVKFGAALLNDDFIDTNAKQVLFSSQHTTANKATGYGLGWFVARDSNNRKVWYHTGELPSSGSILLIYPDQNIVIGLLSNSPLVSDNEGGILSDIQYLMNEIIDIGNTQE